jgi:hypothetical protein
MQLFLLCKKIPIMLDFDDYSLFMDVSFCICVLIYIVIPFSSIARGQALESELG